MDSNLIKNQRSVFFKEGEHSNKLFIIKSGQVLCLKAAKDRLIPVYLASEGDIIGESTMLSDSVYPYSAIALTEVEFIEVPSSSFEEVFKSSPEWLIRLSRSMVNRFEETANFVAENRMVHPSIISDEIYNTQMEIEFKKLLN